MKNFQAVRGFTLVEFLVVAAIIGTALIAFLPELANSGEEERVGEVRSNIRTIQIALERYAVDSGGYYPYMLYGGDFTDTFAKLGAPKNPDTGYSYYLPQFEPGYAAFPGDYDVLIQYGYLGQYPVNPFRADVRPGAGGRIITNPAENGFGPLEFHLNICGRTRTNIWALPFDRALYYVRRQVGGADGTLMWDVSEGQRHAPWPVVIVPSPEPNWMGYVNPSYSPHEISISDDYQGSHQFIHAPGNFYYYGVFEGMASYSGFITSFAAPDPHAPLSGWVIGYRLCGYGAPTNVGDDVYNLWGDYEERSLMTTNLVGRDPSLDWISAGPDGRPDGVIIVVDSYVEFDD